MQSSQKISMVIIFIIAASFTFSCTKLITILDERALAQNTRSIPNTKSNFSETAKNITQTGTNVTFDFIDTNFSNGTGSVIAYTGGNVSNFSETGATNLFFSGGFLKGMSVFTKCISSTHYEYLITLTNNLGNVISRTGAFTTAGAPISLNTGRGTQTGVVDDCLLFGTCARVLGADMIVPTNQDSVIISTKQADDTITTVTFLQPPVILTSMRDVQLADISLHWARDYISNLVARGIIDNEIIYNPDNNLTRAEFLKISFNAASWKTNTLGTTPFKDVREDRWYAPYISLALSRDIISDSYLNFRPNESITRGEAAKIIVGIFGVKLATTETSFIDVDPTSDLVAYIETANNLGFFTGQVTNGQALFHPNDFITRADIAKVIVTVFNL